MDDANQDFVLAYVSLGMDKKEVANVMGIEVEGVLKIRNVRELDMYDSVDPTKISEGNHVRTQ